MKLIWKDELVYLRINGKLIRLESNADVELEFPNIVRLEWIEAETKRIEKGGE